MDLLNPANPLSPLSPLNINNPYSPLSPLNPANQAAYTSSSTTTASDRPAQADEPVDGTAILGLFFALVVMCLVGALVHDLDRRKGR